MRLLPRMDDTASLRSGSSALTAGSAGTKRKKTGEPKFYAVRQGHTPGIYHTWVDCLKQVTGFKGATCQLMLTRQYETNPIG